MRWNRTREREVMFQRTVGEHVLGGNARAASNGVEGDAFAK